MDTIPVVAFGEYADKSFLKKLSSQNLGFSRHIYEAADASLQLQDFYSKISSPVLSNVTFKYVEGISDVTKTHYPIFFNGSELVVAGRIGSNSNIPIHPHAWCITGPIVFNITRTEPVSSLERLWAYLTVKHIFRDRETATNATELTKKALDLSLKYSFVTEVSSLVVVKPNQTNTAESKPTAPRQDYPSPYLSAKTAGGGCPFYLTTPRPFLRPRRSTTTALPIQNSNIPQWLDTLKQNNENITTPQGTFKIGQAGDVTTYPHCPKTPTNVCTIIFDCPEIYSSLTDISVYLQYFCPLNEFAGVCCPTKPAVPIP